MSTVTMLSALGEESSGTKNLSEVAVTSSKSRIGRDELRVESLAQDDVSSVIRSQLPAKRPDPGEERRGGVPIDVELLEVVECDLCPGPGELASPHQLPQ